MNPLKIFCFVALLVAAASAAPKHGKNKDNAVSSSLKPTDWLSVSELQSMQSAEDFTMQQLENMSVEEGEREIEKIYHLSQINHALEPSFVPSPSNVPVLLMKPNGQPEQTTLNEMVDAAKKQPSFGNEEVTIFITGLPQTSPAVAKANKKLVQAYMQRYYGQQQPINSNKDYDDGNQAATSSEEDYSESWKHPKATKGDLVIINLGSTLTNMKRFALLDVEQTGNMIGKALVQLTNEVDVPQEIIHIVAQGIGAQVAGAAGRQYRRLTGHQLRRITALDPSKMFATNKYELTGLARGDADLVDAIHTSTCGMGTRQRVGDVDFYVNGPASSVPGATNVVEASMRATRYYAETVRPGNERNFPAVPANSMEQYVNNEGAGKRAYMGIATEFDLEGDYILKVNSKSPFGKSAPAQKQTNYHGMHQSWKSSKSLNQDY
ncbi:vitellogenin-1-like [Rhagoletis pomonella]|uniref:vitellogenin-1-like n=1 Tax=Rhagoletis pomonella TaxID=28610 RepID=UPI0017833A8A|nr:vitellogenin-1-like [Rhagoletis pomonella]